MAVYNACYWLQERRDRLSPKGSQSLGITTTSQKYAPLCSLLHSQPALSPIVGHLLAPDKLIIVVAVRSHPEASHKTVRAGVDTQLLAELSDGAMEKVTLRANDCNRNIREAEDRNR